jgi:hypothetical protein
MLDDFENTVDPEIFKSLRESPVLSSRHYSRASARTKLVWGLKKTIINLFIFLELVEVIKMLNSASKCLKIPT